MSSTDNGNGAAHNSLGDWGSRVRISPLRPTSPFTANEFSDRAGDGYSLEAERNGIKSPGPAQKVPDIVPERSVLMHPDQIVDLRREFTTLRNKLHPVHDFEKQRSMTVLVGRLEEMLKRLDDEELHATFPALVAYHVRLHGRLRFARRAVCVRIIQ